MIQASATGSLTFEWGHLLYEVSKQFASSLELDEVLSQVLRLTVEALGASEGSIFLLDSRGNVQRSILAHNHLSPEINRVAVTHIMYQGFAGWIYTNRKADILFDTEADERWLIIPGDTIVTGSAMGAPLIRRDAVIGIMTLLHIEKYRFTPRHLLLLEMIAAQAASAIENAAIYTQANDERRKLKAIIAGVRDATLVTDLQSRLILANPAAQRILGLSDASYGGSLEEVLREAAVLGFYQRAVGGEEIEQDVVLGDGRVFNCSLVTIPGLGFVLGMHDVTAFKKLDALKSEFVSHVSHDLKTPLGVIQGYVWLLDQLPGLDAEARDYVQEIFHLIERMTGLISNLLDLNKIEMGIEADFQTVDLVEIMSGAVESLRAVAIEKHIHLSAESAEKTLPVHGSPIRLGQAVSNLVGNALKFTPLEGNVRVWLVHEDGRAILNVSDTGPGIPPALRPMLFQKFSRLGQRSTQTQEGHGLGLAIVKSILEAHKGQVWVESTLGQGSTFSFSLPVFASGVLAI